LLVVSTHVRAHCLKPSGHVVPQAPLLHTCVALQATSQEPQWFAFVERSSHCPLQLAELVQICVQLPPAQLVPPVQTLPTVPQLLESELSVTHASTAPALP
jgi:hypothetical protein